PLEAMVLNRPCKLEACGLLLLQNDASKDFFVAHGIGRGDHRHLGDRGMLGERGFHPQRGDVLPGAADDVLDPVDEVELAVLAAAHRVAGVEPAAAPGFLGGSRVLQVAGEETAARIGTGLPDQQLPGLLFNLYFKTWGRAAEAPRADVARL